MICWILLLIKLSCCVCAPTFEVNATQSFYQAEEKQNVTLEMTFPPTADGSLTSLYATCYMITDVKDSVLLELIGGVQVSESEDEQFAGRVHCDTDVLKEGRLRLHMSSLRTEDSGRYKCEMMIDGVVGVGESLLNVSGVEPKKSPDERKHVTTNKDQSGGLIAGEIVAIVAIVGIVVGCIVTLVVLIGGIVGGWIVTLVVLIGGIVGGWIVTLVVLIVGIVGGWIVGLIGVILGVIQWCRNTLNNRNREQPGADGEEEIPFQ